MRPVILFMVPNLGNGGAEGTTITLLRHLDRQRFEPHLAVLSKAGPNLAHVPADVEVHELGGRARSVAFPLIRLCSRLRPSVIFSNLSHLNTAVIACKPLLPGKPAIVVNVCTVLGSMISAHRSLRGRIYRLLYSKADAVVCQSEDMVCDMADNFRVPLNKIVKIFNPIDPDELIRLSSGPNPYPVEDPINLITMGRFSAVKRHDFMFHALGEVLKVFPEVKLHLFGDGPLESELRAQTHFLNIDHAVIFHGYLANPFPFLRHADLYLLSSDYEGLCNALLEALSLKVPAISRNCPGGVRDVTRYTSLLNIVNDDTPTAFAKAVIAALDSPSRSAPEEEQDFMRDNFGTESVLAKYHDLFGKFV